MLQIVVMHALVSLLLCLDSVKGNLTGHRLGRGRNMLPKINHPGPTPSASACSAAAAPNAAEPCANHHPPRNGSERRVESRVDQLHSRVASLEAAHARLQPQLAATHALTAALSKTQRAQSSLANTVRCLEFRVEFLNTKILNLEAALLSAAVSSSPTTNPSRLSTPAEARKEPQRPEQQTTTVPISYYPPSFTYDMPLLHFRIAELNALINKDASHSIKPLNAPRPQTPKKLHLSLYADGITVNKGPLRPFTDSATHAFLQDINDGYFPYELRHLYPEGVPFVLHDEITRQYADACASFVPFTGTGRLLKADVEELLIGTQQSRTEQSESINLDSVRKARLSLHGETNINVKSSNSIDMKSQQTILVPNESNPDGFTTTASMPTITPTNHVFIRVHSIHGHSLLCLVPQGWTQRDFLDALRPRVAKPFRILARQGNGRWEEVRESESTMALFQGRVCFRVVELVHP